MFFKKRRARKTPISYEDGRVAIRRFGLAIYDVRPVKLTAEEWDEAVKRKDIPPVAEVDGQIRVRLYETADGYLYNRLGDSLDTWPPETRTGVYWVPYKKVNDFYEI